MVISKFICIPLLIFVPLIILIVESQKEDFTVPPSDAEVRAGVSEWRVQKAGLDPELFSSKSGSNSKPKVAVSPSILESGKPATVDYLKGIDLKMTPVLNHFQGMKRERLKGVASQLDPKLYSELIYLANERLIDSATDATKQDFAMAGKYVSQHSRPMWNPGDSLRVSLKVHLMIEEKHFEAAQVLGPKIQQVIFHGSGGTVEPIVIVTKSERKENSIHLEGEQTTAPIGIESIPDIHRMLADGLQLAATQLIADKELPILHTDKIHYTYYTRFTWQSLAEALH